MDKMVQMANLKGPIWFTLRIPGRHVPPRPPLKYAYVNNRFNLISKPKTSLWHGKEKYASIVFYATACCILYYSMTLVTLLQFPILVIGLVRSNAISCGGKGGVVF